MQNLVGMVYYVLQLNICDKHVSLSPEMSDPLLNPLTVICAGSCFAFSGLFYKLYCEKKQEIQKLKVMLSL